VTPWPPGIGLCICRRSCAGSRQPARGDFPFGQTQPRERTSPTRPARGQARSSGMVIIASLTQSRAANARRSSRTAGDGPVRPLGDTGSGRSLLGARRRASNGVAVHMHALDNHAGRVRVRDCRFLLADQASRQRDVVHRWLSSGAATSSAVMPAAAVGGEAGAGWAGFGDEQGVHGLGDTLP
jgi:hypothetical protein